MLSDAERKFLAQQRVAQALEHLPGTHVLSSSFGAQSAVMLHLVNQVIPGIPVVLIDTGYLFPETYRFIDQLTEKLQLNLNNVTDKLYFTGVYYIGTAENHALPSAGLRPVKWA